MICDIDDGFKPKESFSYRFGRFYSFLNSNSDHDWLSVTFVQLSIVKVTDNCAKEFKCAESFQYRLKSLYQTELSEELGVLVMPVQRERFHGRGDHDAEGGIGKRAVDEAVRAKVNIHCFGF